RFPQTFYVRSGQSADQFHEACLVRITNGGLAVWLHPVGMLQPQVVVNPLPELGVGVDLVSHGSRFSFLVFAFRDFSSWELISGHYPFLRKILAGVAKKFTDDRADPPSQK